MVNCNAEGVCLGWADQLDCIIANKFIVYPKRCLTCALFYNCVLECSYRQVHDDHLHDWGTHLLD